ITAVSDIDDAITHADRGWPQWNFSPAQLDLTGLKSSHLRDSARILFDYIHIAGIAGRHPQFPSRAIISKIVERNNAACTGQGDWREFIVRGDLVPVQLHCCQKKRERRDCTDLHRL